MKIENGIIYPDEGKHLKNIKSGEIYPGYIIPAKSLTESDFVEVSEEEYQAYINNGKMEVIEPKKEFFQNPKTKTAAILSGCKNISKVKVIDEHHIFASDWGVTFTCSNIPKEISYIGIRAHYFKPVEVENGVNCIPVNEYHLLEDVFEWNLSFKTKDGSSWLQWKKAKEENERDKLDIPKAFCVDEKDILFLM